MKKGNKNITTAQYFLELIKYKPGLHIAAVILFTIGHIIPLVSGFVVRDFFDIIGGTASTDTTIMKLVIITLVITVVRIVAIQLGFRASVKYDYFIGTLLRRNILNLILKKPGAKAISTTTGEAINSIRDDVGQVESVMGWIIWLVGQLLFSVISVVILLTINVRLTLFVVVPFFAVIAFAQKFEQKIESNRATSRDATANVSGAIGEIFESVLTIKVSGEEKAIVDNLKKLNENRHKVMIKDSILTNLINSIYNNAVVWGTGLILIFSGQEMLAGRFSVGDFAIFVYYLVFVTEGIESLGNFLVFFKQTKVAFNRIEDLVLGQDKREIVKHKNICVLEKDVPQMQVEESKLAEHDRVPKNNEEVLKTFSAEGLTYQYENSENGIKSVDLKLDKGKTLVIAGRTGSGKSTLLKALLGLLPAQSGQVCWNDTVIEEAKEFLTPPMCAYTSQVPNLFSSTVKENILFGLSESEAALGQAINAAVLEKDLKGLENGLDTVVGDKGAKLSGGQRQRVAAARMFVRNSQLLVLDDISSALDVETEKVLWSRLFGNDKPTCIIVSNRKFVLEQADQVILMKDGCVEAQGNLGQILEHSLEMQKIIGQEAS